MKILLTNDDGRDSKLLEIAADHLKRWGDLEIAVPAEEQSWKGKSITRHGKIDCQEDSYNGCKVYKISGTPADCVNLAIHQLMDSKPDLVVSGINIGANMGVSFIFSSGTVGGCLEANIAGIPAVALSQSLSSTLWKSYHQDRNIPNKDLDYFRKVSGLFVDRFFNSLEPSQGLLGDPITWNITLPDHLKDQPQIVACPAGVCTYGNCFFPSDDGGYFHNLVDVYDDNKPDTDVRVAQAGNIAITPLDINSFGQLNGHAHKALDTLCD